MFRTARNGAVHRRQQALKPADDAVHHRSKREGQEFLAPCEVVPDGTDRQACLVGHFAQRSTFEPVNGDNAENRLDYVLPPGAGIYNFGHHPY